MKVLFIYSLDDIAPAKKPLRTWSTMQFGISAISAILKAHGHQTELVVLPSNFRREASQLAISKVEKFDPRLVCFTAVHSQYAFIEKMAATIKGKWPDRYLLIGGAHASLRPEEVSNGPFDAVCVGEGEYPALELCRQLESQPCPGDIANLWIRRSDGSFERNAPRDFIQDLDLLPFPDREIWKSWIDEQNDDEMTILGGRGCPFECTYCSNHALRRVAGGRYVRMRSPENILREVAFIYENFPHRRISFEVETIAFSKSWAMELCRRLAEFNAGVDEPISFGSHFRITPQSSDESLFAAMKEANFKLIHIGLESGSERIRRDVLKRNYSNVEFLRTVSLARKYGMKVYVFNMIGLPGETLDDHMETVKINRQCQPDGHHTGIFYPYPGTELYDTCIRQDLIKRGADVHMERKEPLLDLPGFSRSKIRSAYTWFNYRVYRGFRPLRKILADVALVKMQSCPCTNLMIQKLVQSQAMGFVRKVKGGMAD